eukprot:1487668-Pleurochrysis_carterae.AAC.2
MLCARLFNQVRDTMLQYKSVLNGQVIFRFVIGNTLTAGAQKNVMAENMTKGDMLQLDAIDGPGIKVACSCGEKTFAWFQYALKAWPGAAMIGKTEDDTYLQLDNLLRELQSVSRWPRLLYGFHTLAVLPKRPTPSPERVPTAACVSLLSRVRGKATWRTFCAMRDDPDWHAQTTLLPLLCQGSLSRHCVFSSSILLTMIPLRVTWQPLLLADLFSTPHATRASKIVLMATCYPLLHALKVASSSVYVLVECSGSGGLRLLMLLSPATRFRRLGERGAREAPQQARLTKRARRRHRADVTPRVVSWATSKCAPHPIPTLSPCPHRQGSVCVAA